ncbi:hypothetical protein TWF281_006867 [Arthrobotrys megalospora]
MPQPASASTAGRQEGGIPWDHLRGTIEDLYLRQKFTNKKIIDFIAEKNGLVVTKSQLEYQMKKWKIRKNMKKEDYIFAQITINKSNSGGPTQAPAHEIYLNGVRQSARKVKKGLWRHKAREEARYASETELQYCISDGLDIDIAYSLDPATNGSYQKDDLLEGVQMIIDGVPDDSGGGALHQHQLFLVPQNTFQDTAYRATRNPNFAISRVREVGFIYDFIQRTLFVMENELWNDLEWEPAVLRLINTHKLNSLLTSIMQLGTYKSAKLGDFLVRAVCHRYQNEYDAEYLQFLFSCGCEPSLQTQLDAYLCEDAQKIKYFLRYSNLDENAIQAQCTDALLQSRPALFEAILAPGESFVGPELRGLLQSWLSFKGEEIMLAIDPCSRTGLRFTSSTGLFLNVKMLMKAVNDRNNHVAQIVSEGMDLKRPEYLFYAIVAGDEFTTQWLLDALVNPNTRFTACTGETLLGVEPLYGGGFITEAPEYSVTPLLTALREGYGGIVERLLRAGAKPNLRGSIPPLYKCSDYNKGPHREFECNELETYFKEISPLELAVLRGFEIDVLLKLWAAGARFYRPERTWTFVLMYTKVGSPEFNFVADALLKSQPGRHAVALRGCRRVRRFHLRRNQDEKTRYDLFVQTPGFEPPEVALQTYSADRLQSMVYHTVAHADDSRWGTLVDNLTIIGDSDTSSCGSRILQHTIYSRYIRDPSGLFREFSSRRECAQAVKFVDHAMRNAYPISCYSDIQGILLSGIIQSAWRGIIDKDVLKGYLKVFSGLGAFQSHINIALIYAKLKSPGGHSTSIVKLFSEAVSVDRKGKQDRGMRSLPQRVIRALDFLMEIGWDAKEQYWHPTLGLITVLDIILKNYTPDETTFTAVKKICGVGAPVASPNLLSIAIEARRDIFKASFDREQCWALRTIKFLLQLEGGCFYSGNLWTHHYTETTINGSISTPLQVAAYYGDLELAKLFLEAGDDPNSIPIRPPWIFEWKPMERTPLELAAERCRKDMIVLLLRSGATFTVKARRNARFSSHIERLLAAHVIPEQAEHIPRGDKSVN